MQAVAGRGKSGRRHDATMAFHLKDRILDLKRLRYFCVIVEQGSISKAAQVLCMSQPPLSKRLQELEEEVGTELLVRTGRRLEPTEAGQFLYQKACEILRSVEDAKCTAVKIASTERRMLRVGISYLFLRHFLPLAKALYLQNPRAEISVSVSDSSHLEQLLHRGRLDVALIQRPHSPEGFDLIEFAPLRLKALVARSLLPDGTADALPLAALGRHPLILLRRVEGVGTFEALLGHLRKSGIQPNVKMHVSDPAIAIEMLDAGVDAVAFVPESEAVASRSGRYACVNIRPNPLQFHPVAARLSTSIEIPEVTATLAGFLKH